MNLSQSQTKQASMHRLKYVRSRRLSTQSGEATFWTRAVLSIAKLTTPTLHHHFGNAGRLLGAAMTEAVEQFLRRKHAAEQGGDPLEDLATAGAITSSSPRSDPAYMNLWSSGSSQQIGFAGPPSILVTPVAIVRVSESDRSN